MATIILRPTGAGAETAIQVMHPNTGEAHWQDVDEVVADGDATYVQQALAGTTRDLYAITSPGLAGTIDSVTVYVRCRYVNNPIGQQCKASIRSGATTADGTANNLTTSYANYSYTWTTNPDTGIAFTTSDLASLQIGVVLVQPSSSTSLPRCTQVWCVVTYTDPPAPAYHCRVAFASDIFADTPVWTDVSSDMMAFAIRRGRQYEINRMETGTAVITLSNIAGDYWPLTGTYDIDTGKKVEVYVTYDSVEYRLYTGYVESWTPYYLLPGMKVPAVDVECSDLIRVLSRTRLNSAGYAQELSGTRIGNVLDDAGFPAADRTITGAGHAGICQMQATGALVNIIAQDHIYSVCDSEIGLFYQAVNGYAVFEDRSLRSSATYGSIWGTTGDDWVLPIQNVRPALDDLLTFCEVRATNLGGTEQVASDATSEASYGYRSLVLSLLLTPDLQALIVAMLLLARYKTPAYRYKEIQIMEDIDKRALMLPKMLGYDISSEIRLDIPVEGITKSDYFIEHIQHDWDIRQGGYLITTWMLSDAAQYFATPPATPVDDTIRPDGTDSTTGSISIIGGSGSIHAALADASDSTYVRGDDSGTATVTMANPSYPHGTINSVTAYWRGKYEDASGSFSNVNRIIIDGVNYDQNNSYGGIFQTYSRVFTVNPNTGNPWTWAEVNAIKMFANCPYVSGYRTDVADVWVVINFTIAWA